MTTIDDSNTTPPDYWFGAISGRLRERMRDELHELDLGRRGWRVLHTLADGPATAEELAAALPRRGRRGHGRPDATGRSGDPGRPGRAERPEGDEPPGAPTAVTDTAGEEGGASRAARADAGPSRREWRGRPDWMHREWERRQQMYREWMEHDLSRPDPWGQGAQHGAGRPEAHPYGHDHDHSYGHDHGHDPHEYGDGGDRAGSPDHSPEDGQGRHEHHDQHHQHPDQHTHHQHPGHDHHHAEQAFERGFERGFARGVERGTAFGHGGFGPGHFGRGFGPGAFASGGFGPGSFGPNPFGHDGHMHPRHGRPSFTGHGDQCRGGVDRILADFVERGWVWFDDDRATLTDEGRAAHDAAAERMRAVRATLTEGVGPADLATTLATLETMARNLGWAPDAQQPHAEQHDAQQPDADQPGGTDAD